MGVVSPPLDGQVLPAWYRHPSCCVLWALLLSVLSLTVDFAAMTAWELLMGQEPCLAHPVLLPGAC